MNFEINNNLNEIMFEDFKDFKDIENINNNLNKNEAYLQKLNFIVKEINNMPENRHIEILSIIDKYTNKYTENNNGVFINLSQLEPNIIKKIYEYIIYIKIQEKNIEKIEKEKNDYSNIIYNN